MAKDHPHDGHRARLRQQIQENGIDGMPPHVLLEFLLFYCIPRGDVNPIAHALMERFGTLSGVLDASAPELMKVKGVGESTAQLLTALPAIFRRYGSSRSGTMPAFMSAETLGDYIADCFIGRKVETILLVSLNARNSVIATRVVAEGSIGSVSLPVRRIVEEALAVGAAAVAIGHNHPGGFAIPSDADVSSTLNLRAVLEPLGIKMLDHVVVGEDDYVSMLQSGYFAAAPLREPGTRAGWLMQE